MIPLEQKISALYDPPLPPQEAKTYANRLIDFYKVLWEIDRTSGGTPKKGVSARSASDQAAAEPQAPECGNTPRLGNTGGNQYISSNILTKHNVNTIVCINDAEMNMAKASKVSVFDQWGARDDKRLAAKPLSLRLPTHVMARLFALEELYPNKSRNDLLIDLLKVGLEEFEEDAELTYVFHDIEDNQGNPLTIKEPAGLRADFQKISNKHYKKLEIEKGNKSPLELFKIQPEEV